MSSSRQQPPTDTRQPGTSGMHPSSSTGGSSSVNSSSGGVTAVPTASSSSTLVETVSINYDDFNESFLTCSTCLCAYDQQLRRPKLLACSHTVCAQCLQRIVELPLAQDTGSFRCPICRELHQIPRGGVHCLPPSFLVNQLIDLMQKQRRDVVPKCGAHPAEELLFCETCDTVFCQLCATTQEQQEASVGGTPSKQLQQRQQQCHNHTIVPFSIAIKRMSEILLYKANQCVKNLNRAAENVQREMSDLDHNVDRILDEVNASFQDLSQLMDSRRKELVEKVRETRDTKRKVLQDQLGIIQSEKAKVEQQCNGLQYQVEVRNITRRIADLNQKLDSTMTLVEPRENAFLRYDSTTKEVLQGIQRALAHFGQLSVSRTFPSLCTAEATPSYVNIEGHASVNTIDYNGERRQSGGDPVEAKMTRVSSCYFDPNDSPTSPRGDQDGYSMQQQRASTLLFVGGDIFDPPSDPRTRSLVIGQTAPPIDDDDIPAEVGVTVTDNDDGTYNLYYRAPYPGRYRLEIWIFGRQIKSSPLTVTVSSHHVPEWQFGSYGSGQHHLCQPVRVCSLPATVNVTGAHTTLFVLDTGNNRVRIMNAADGTPTGCLEGDSLLQQSSVGLAAPPLATPSAGSPAKMTLLTLNWRTRRVSEWTVTPTGGEETKSFTFSEFVEPIDLAVDNRGRILVADNGAKKIFVFDTFYRPLFSFPVLANPKQAQQQSPLIGSPEHSPLSPNHRRQAATLPPPRGVLTQQQQPQLQSQVTCVAVGMNEDILVGGGNCVFLYDSAGCFVRVVNVLAAGGGGVKPNGNVLIGGVAVDRASGYVLTSVSEGRGRTYVSVSSYKGDVRYTLDSHGAKLRRPSGVCVSAADRNVCYVADLGNHSVKRFRFK